MRRALLLCAIVLVPGLVVAGPAAGPSAAQRAALAEADRIYSRIETLFGEGKYDDAIEPARKVHALRAKALGPDHPDALSSLVDVALLLDLAGRFAESEAVSLQAIAAYRRTLGERDAGTLKARSDYAQMLANAGRYREAAAINEEVLALRREVEGPDGELTLHSMNNLADNYASLGRYEEALEMQRAGLEASTRVLGADAFNTNITRNNVAFALQRLGRPQEALPYAEESVERLTRTLGADHPHTINGLARMTTVYADLGRTADAVRVGRRVLELSREVFGPRNPNTLLATNDLAVFLRDAGAAAEALALRQQAMPVMVEVWGPRHRETLTARNNLADSLSELGRHEEALAIEREVLAIRAADLGPRHPDALEDQRKVALELVALGRSAEALPLLQETLAARRAVLGDRHPATLESLFDLGDLAGRLGRHDEAVSLMEEMVAGVEALRAAGDLAADDRQALFARWAPRYGRLALERLRTGAVERAFEVAELSRARTLLEGNALRRATSALAPADRDRVQGYEARLASLDRQLAAVREPEARVALQSQRNAAVREYAALRRELAARAPRYARLQEVTVLGPSAARGLLPRRTRLVSYLVVGPVVAAIVVDDRGRAQGRVLGEAPWLAATVESHRRILASPDGLLGLLRDGQKLWRTADGGFRLAEDRPAPDAERSTDAAAPGRALSALLIAPLVGSLAGADRLLISPAGQLALLPFETLEAAGALLVERVAVSYAQSLSTLAQAAGAAPRGPATLLAMGGVEYAGARGPDDAARGSPDAAYRMLDLAWPDLPGSAAEVRGIAELFGTDRATAFVGKEATEATLRRLSDEGALARFRFVLLSAHGFLSTTEPALSAVVLGRTGTAAAEDGYVTASELPGLAFGSELIVLSACETGLGALVRGEGVTGLPFALMVAGNRRTALSLWPVVDDSTREFMTRYFARLQRGEAPARALAQVKREFRRDPRYGAPLYWAPFVLYGL